MTSLVTITESEAHQDHSTVSDNDSEQALGAMKTLSIREVEKRPARRLHAKTYLAIFTVCLIYYVQLVNLVGAGAQTQVIAAALGGSNRSVWISSPLAILTVVLSPIASQAADYWGRRVVLVTLTGMGAVGSIIVARATTMSMAIAGFTVSGLAYGAQPLLHAVASEVLPRRYRSWGQAADLCSNALGGITALLVGGALNRDSSPTSQSFRAFWYMTTALFAVAAILTVFLYHPPPTERQALLHSKEKLKQLDWVGYGLLSFGLVLFSIGLSWSENPFPWSNAHTSATFSVGLFLAILLCVYEIFIKRDGMFHHDLFKNRNFPLALACICLEGVAFFAANQYFAFEVGTLYQSDNLLVGTRYSISMLVSIPAALGTGYYCSARRRVKWVTVLAFVLYVAFFVGMATSGPGDSKIVWGLPVLLGFGLGMTLCALITVAQLSTPPGLIAMASGLIISIRSLGGAVGLAIYNAIFDEKMKAMGANVAHVAVPMGLEPQYIGAFIAALSSKDEAALGKIPGVTRAMTEAAAAAVLETYTDGFQAVWTAAACFVGIAVILAGFLHDPQDEFNMTIDASVEAEMELFAVGRRCGLCSPFCGVTGNRAGPLARGTQPPGFVLDEAR